MQPIKKMELLAPAGDLEKLKIAVDYGADAVYFGGEMFSLRAGAGNLSTDVIKEGVEYAHRRGVKCHMAFNIFAHNEDIGPMTGYLRRISDIPIDAFIVSDPGVMAIVRDARPDAELHLSTQANMTNYATANFWYSQGVKRLVLARELTFDEIKEIRENIPEDMELEAFAHGAMCISYSGRCLLSNFMIDRDANRGQCAHPCRWKYRLVEEQRPGEYYPIEEDDRGTYIMNSKDLCMLEYIPELAQAGISSLKIEGRMKSIFYVASVVGAYRKAIDKPTDKDQNYQTSDYTRDYSFVGLVRSYDPDTKMAVVEQRNKMVLGDEIEVFGPGADFFTQKLEIMENEDGEPVESAPHPQQILKIRMEQPVAASFMLRKKKYI